MLSVDESRMRQHQEVKFNFLDGTWCFLRQPPGFELASLALSLSALLDGEGGGASHEELLVSRGQHVNRHVCLPFGQIV